jgi:FOG: GGDEF domain
VSVGIAEFDPREPSEGDLLVSADRALYRAKAAGGMRLHERVRTQAHRWT